jgi:hypothetical protein
LESYEDLLAYKARLLRAVEQRRKRYASGDEQSETLELEFIEVTDAGQAHSRKVEVNLS